jgi:hypothetical protein
MQLFYRFLCNLFFFNIHCVTYYNLGGGFGNFWGGFLASRIGRESGFQLMALISAFIGVLYYVFYCCFLKKTENGHVNRTNETFAISNTSVGIIRTRSDVKLATYLVQAK